MTRSGKSGPKSGRQKWPRTPNCANLAKIRTFNLRPRTFMVWEGPFLDHFLSGSGRPWRPLTTFERFAFGPKFVRRFVYKNDKNDVFSIFVIFARTRQKPKKTGRKNGKKLITRTRAPARVRREKSSNQFSSVPI